MDTTELIKNSLDWADKRLDLKGKKLTEEQRNYITFALRQNLVKNIAVTHCCKSDSEQLLAVAKYVYWNYDESSSKKPEDYLEDFNSQ